MKTFKKTILVILAVVAVSLTSCNKDDDGGGGGGAASGTISAKVEGSNFKSAPISTSAVLQSGNLTIIGTTSTGSKAINLIINGYNGEGSYDVGGSNSVFVVGTYIEVDLNNPQNSKTWSAPFDSTVQGEVNISEASDTKVKGTFNFKGKNDEDGSFKNVTEGSFNVEL